jgi:TrmH family RNA methyltransferase
MTHVIESPRNERLKELRKLRDHKQRERSGLFAAEGEDLLAEALRFGALPRVVFHDADRIRADEGPLADLPAGIEKVAVRGVALEAVSSLGSGARVIGVWPQRWSPLPGGAEGEPEELPAEQPTEALYLHDVADPGNVGAVLRSALALARAIVVLSPHTADPFGPKAARASMGAVFGQPVARADFDQARAALGFGWRSVAMVPRAGLPLPELDPGPRTFFCVGSERTGLPAAVVEACDEVAHVPLRPDGAESLNVAMTATLCLYQQRLHKLPPS